MNLVSKQARFGRPTFGSAQFQVDQWGHKLGLVDIGSENRGCVLLRDAVRKHGGVQEPVAIANGGKTTRIEIGVAAEAFKTLDHFQSVVAELHENSPISKEVR